MKKTILVLFCVLAICGCKETTTVAGRCRVIDKNGKVSPIYNELQYCMPMMSKGSELRLVGAFELGATK